MAHFFTSENFNILYNKGLTSIFAIRQQVKRILERGHIKPKLENGNYGSNHLKHEANIFLRKYNFVVKKSIYNRNFINLLYAFVEYGFYGLAEM